MPHFFEYALMILSIACSVSSMDNNSIAEQEGLSTTVAFAQSTQDTFVAKRIPWFSQEIIPLGQVKAGDQLNLEFDNFRGKLREIQVVVGDQIIFCQSKIKKRLLVSGLEAPTAGPFHLLINNKRGLFPKRLRIRVSRSSFPKRRPVDPNVDLPDLLNAPTSIDAIKDTTIRNSKVRFLKNLTGDLIQSIQVEANPQEIPLCSLKYTIIPPMTSRTFKLGAVAPLDTISIKITQLKGGKLSELSLKSADALRYLRGKIPRDIINGSEVDTIKRNLEILDTVRKAGTYELVISNKGQLFGRIISLEAVKRTAAVTTHFFRDTVDTKECRIVHHRDSTAEVFRHDFSLVNWLNIEQVKNQEVRLEIRFPDTLLENRNINGWQYLILPPGNDTLSENPIPVSGIRDPYPALRNNVCYFMDRNDVKKLDAISAGKPDLYAFFYTNSECPDALDYFSRTNYYSTTIKLDSPKDLPNPMYFFAKNMNRDVEMKASLRIYLRESLTDTLIQQCPIIRYSARPVVLP